VVVFAAGGCEALLHEMGHMFEGAVAEGAVASRWNRGALVSSSQVTIVDDPGRIPGGRGEYARDDEGCRPRKVTLIEGGRIADRIVGVRPGSGVELANSTGHARRASYLDPPLPRLACTVMEPGADDPESLVSTTRKGILVRQLGSSSVDPESGRMTLSITEAVRIEGGCVTGSIAPSWIVSDVPTMLASIEAVGSDLTFDHGATNCVKADQHLPVIVGMPTVRIGMVKVISP